MGGTPTRSCGIKRRGRSVADQGRWQKVAARYQYANTRPNPGIHNELVEGLEANFTSATTQPSRSTVRYLVLRPLLPEEIEAEFAAFAEDWDKSLRKHANIACHHLPVLPGSWQDLTPDNASQW